MQTNPEHITFRPGALIDRLTRGPLSPGATAKGDLNRYYILVNTQYDLWFTGNAVTSGAWDVVVAFVSTRAWETVPYPVMFQEQFNSFLRSPMAKDFDRVEKSKAATAIGLASYADVVAIVDHAEEIAFTLGYMGLAGASEGPTSEADGAPQP
jgi:hypothetical protein